MFVEIESIPVLFFAANVLIIRITVDFDTQSKVNAVIIACFRYADTGLVPVFDISFDRRGPALAKNSLKWLATDWSSFIMASPKVK